MKLPALAAALCLLAVIAPTGARAATPAGALPVHGEVARLRSQREFTLRVAPTVEEPRGLLVDVRRESGRPTLRTREELDAFYDPAGRRVFDVAPGDAGIAGMPDAAISSQLDVGDAMPDLVFLDQTGRRFALSDFRGKTVLLSFFYTRCPDREICPAISGKFAYLQTKIDPSRTQLIELSVDPAGDSPRALAAYAAGFGADPTRWRLAVAQRHTTSDALALFGLSNLEGNPGRFLHDDVLAFIGPDGRVLQLVATVGWEPADVLASIEHFNGFASNPLRRWQLAAVAGIISACGGSVTTGVAIMDSLVFLVGVVVLGGILVWFGRKIWAK